MTTAKPRSIFGDFLGLGTAEDRPKEVMTEPLISPKLHV